MKGKSIVVSLISFAVAMLGLFSAGMSDQLQLILGGVTLLLTAVLSTFFKTGELPTGWTTVMWVSNIALVVMMVLNYYSGNGFINPAVVTMIGAVINAIINIFLKDYGNGSRLVARK